jgi:hypothetical protein
MLLQGGPAAQNSLKRKSVLGTLRANAINKAAEKPFQAIPTSNNQMSKHVNWTPQ